MPIPNTSGFESQIMPAIQFANPAFFGGLGQSIGQGIAGGVDVMGQLDRQRDAAAMGPLEIQQAKGRIAMQPLAQQEAQNTLEQQKRALMMPPLIPMGEQVIGVPREPEVDQQSYQEALAAGKTPEEAKALATNTDTQPKIDQYKVPTFRNALTGEIVQRPELYKTHEQVEEEKALAAVKVQQGQMYANYGIARMGGVGNAGSRPFVAIPQDSTDGKPHLFKTEIDPATQQPVDRDLGVAAEALSKIEGNTAKNQELGARAAHETAQAENLKKGPGMSAEQVGARAAAQNLQKQAVALAMPANVLKELMSSTDGQQVILARTAHKVDPANNPDFIADPKLLGVYQKAMQSAQNNTEESEAVPAPTASTPVPGVIPPAPNAIPGMAPSAGDVFRQSSTPVKANRQLQGQLNAVLAGRKVSSDSAATATPAASTAKYTVPTQVVQAIKSGAITNAEGIKILKEQFGFSD